MFAWANQKLTELATQIAPPANDPVHKFLAACSNGNEHDAIMCIQGDGELPPLQVTQIIGHPQRGMQPIHYAASSCFFELFKLLVGPQYRIPVDSFDYEGNTPLHHVCQHSQNGTQYLSFVKMLVVEYGASVVVKNSIGKTPYDISTSANVRNYLLPIQLQHETKVALETGIGLLPGQDLGGCRPNIKPPPSSSGGPSSSAPHSHGSMIPPSQPNDAINALMQPPPMGVGVNNQGYGRPPTPTTMQHHPPYNHGNNGPDGSNSVGALMQPPPASYHRGSSGGGSVAGGNSFVPLPPSTPIMQQPQQHQQQQHHSMMMQSLSSPSPSQQQQQPHQMMMTTASIPSPTIQVQPQPTMNPATPQQQQQTQSQQEEPTLGQEPPQDTSPSTTVSPTASSSAAASVTSPASSQQQQSQPESNKREENVVVDNTKVVVGSPSSINESQPHINTNEDIILDSSSPSILHDVSLEDLSLHDSGHGHGHGPSTVNSSPSVVTTTATTNVGTSASPSGTVQQQQQQQQHQQEPNVPIQPQQQPPQQNYYEPQPYPQQQQPEQYNPQQQQQPSIAMAPATAPSNVVPVVPPPHSGGGPPPPPPAAPKSSGGAGTSHARFNTKQAISGNLKYRPDGFHSSSSDTALQAKYGHYQTDYSHVPPPPTSGGSSGAGGPGGGLGAPPISYSAYRNNTNTNQQRGRYPVYGTGAGGGAGYAAPYGAPNANANPSGAYGLPPPPSFAVFTPGGGGNGSTAVPQQPQQGFNPMGPPMGQQQEPLPMMQQQCASPQQSQLNSNVASPPSGGSSIGVNASPAGAVGANNNGTGENKTVGAAPSSFGRPFVPQGIQVHHRVNSSSNNNTPNKN